MHLFMFARNCHGLMCLVLELFSYTALDVMSNKRAVLFEKSKKRVCLLMAMNGVFSCIIVDWINSRLIRYRRMKIDSLYW